MSAHLATQTARNSLFSLVGFVYPILLGLAVTPFVVDRLGTERYGVFALTTALLGFLGILDLGMAPALIKYVSEHLARDEVDEANRVVGVSIVFYTAVGLVGALVSFLVAGLWVGDLFTFPSATLDDARFAFFAAGFGFFFTMLLNAVGSVPASVQRFDVVAKVTVLFSTLTTGLTVLLLSLGYGLRSVVTLNALVPLAALVLYLVIDARIVPEFRPVPRWDRALLARLFSFGGYALVTTLGGALLFHFDKFALGSLAGVALVTFYVVPGALAQKIHSAASQLGVVVFPAASDLLARGELERVRRLYVRATRFIVLFLLSVSIPPLLLAHDLLLHWLGRDFAEKSTSVLVILIATYFVIGLTAVPYFVVLGAGKPKVGAAFSAVPALINVVLVFVLIPPFELTGAATAYLLSTVPVPFFVRYVERRILQLDTRFWLALLVRVLPASAAQAGVCLLLSPLVTGLGTLIAVLAAALPVLVVVYYLLGFFDQGDRELIHQLVPPLGRLSRA